MQITVRQARLFCGKTQREMAQLLHISRDTYRKIEQCPNRATIEQAKHISEITKMEVDSLFFAP